MKLLINKLVSLATGKLPLDITPLMEEAGAILREVGRLHREKGWRKFWEVVQEMPDSYLPGFLAVSPAQLGSMREILSTPDEKLSHFRPPWNTAKGFSALIGFIQLVKFGVLFSRREKYQNALRSMSKGADASVARFYERTLGRVREMIAHPQVLERLSDLRPGFGGFGSFDRSVAVFQDLQGVRNGNPAYEIVFDHPFFIWIAGKSEEEDYGDAYGKWVCWFPSMEDAVQVAKKLLPFFESGQLSGSKFLVTDLSTVGGVFFLVYTPDATANGDICAKRKTIFERESGREAFFAYDRHSVQGDELQSVVIDLSERMGNANLDRGEQILMQCASRLSQNGFGAAMGLSADQEEMIRRVIDFTGNGSFCDPITYQALTCFGGFRKRMIALLPTLLNPGNAAAFRHQLEEIRGQVREGGHRVVRHNLRRALLGTPPRNRLDEEALGSITPVALAQLASQGRADQIITIYERDPARFPTDPTSQSLLCQAASLGKQYELALRIGDPLFHRLRGDARAQEKMVHLAHHLLNAGYMLERYEECFGYGEYLLQVGASLEPARLLVIGKAAAKTARFGRVVEIFDRLEKNPMPPDMDEHYHTFKVNVGVALANTGNPQRAIPLLELCPMEKRAVEWHLIYVRALRGVGRVDDAYARLLDAMTIHPTDPRLVEMQKEFPQWSIQHFEERFPGLESHWEMSRLAESLRRGIGALRSRTSRRPRALQKTDLAPLTHALWETLGIAGMESARDGKEVTVRFEDDSLPPLVFATPLAREFSSPVTVSSEPTKIMLESWVRGSGTDGLEEDLKNASYTRAELVERKNREALLSFRGRLAVTSHSDDDLAAVIAQLSDAIRTRRDKAEAPTFFRMELLEEDSAGLLRAVRIYGPNGGEGILREMGFENAQLEHWGFHRGASSNFLGVCVFEVNTESASETPPPEIMVLLTQDGEFVLPGARPEDLPEDIRDRLHFMCLQALALETVPSLREIILRWHHERTQSVGDAGERGGHVRPRLLATQPMIAGLRLRDRARMFRQLAASSILDGLDMDHLDQQILYTRDPESRIYLPVTDAGERRALLAERDPADIFVRVLLGSTYRLAPYFRVNKAESSDLRTVLDLQSQQMTARQERLYEAESTRPTLRPLLRLYALLALKSEYGPFIFPKASLTVETIESEAQEIVVQARAGESVIRYQQAKGELAAKLLVGVEAQQTLAAWERGEHSELTELPRRVRDQIRGMECATAKLIVLPVNRGFRSPRHISVAELGRIKERET